MRIIHLSYQKPQQQNFYLYFGVLAQKLDKEGTVCNLHSHDLGENGRFVPAAYRTSAFRAEFQRNFDQSSFKLYLDGYIVRTEFLAVPDPSFSLINKIPSFIATSHFFLTSYGLII
uniref:Uncharacterized protein n=1 Tax=Megaselia scalaris TaxID=36166 RepID=T1GEX4_MEGSC